MCRDLVRDYAIECKDTSWKKGSAWADAYDNPMAFIWKIIAPTGEQSKIEDLYHDPRCTVGKRNEEVSKLSSLRYVIRFKTEHARLHVSLSGQHILFILPYKGSTFTMVKF